MMPVSQFRAITCIVYHYETGSFCNQRMLQWLEVMSVIGAGDLGLCVGLKAVQNALKVDIMLYSPYLCS